MTLKEFSIESEMTEPAKAWLKSQGMSVKAEFLTPWGICDLVGVQFNPQNVERRLALKQRKAIGSVFRAAVLLEIPDVETSESVSISCLAAKCQKLMPSHELECELSQLVADHFVQRSSNGEFQKLNGWAPLHQRLVALELKLTRIEEVMRQALNNLAFASESYVGLPSELADRVAARPGRWAAYLNSGVGLVKVSRLGCETLIASSRLDSASGEALEMYCVEKFWRTRLTGN